MHAIKDTVQAVWNSGWWIIVLGLLALQPPLVAIGHAFPRPAWWLWGVTLGAGIAWGWALGWIRGHWQTWRRRQRSRAFWRRMRASDPQMVVCQPGDHWQTLSEFIAEQERADPAFRAALAAQEIDGGDGDATD